MVTFFNRTQPNEYFNNTKTRLLNTPAYVNNLKTHNNHNQIMMFKQDGLPLTGPMGVRKKRAK